jgi:GNAT superfamily N-acetyltransferase
MSSIAYRDMTMADIPAGLLLCRQAGWNQVARDWEIFLKLSPRGCRVATALGQVVGTVASISYQDRFSWIGMVLVHPDYRKQGLGMELLRQAMAILPPGQTIKLDATAAGRQVYLKYGFVDEFELSRMEAKIDQPPRQPKAARLIQKADLPALAAFDEQRFGAHRGPLLTFVFEASRGLSFIADGANGISGYLLARHGNEFIHLGPVVAESREVAIVLVLEALASCSGRRVIIDSPQFDEGWREWLKSLGFSEQRTLMRMYHGNNDHPGLAGMQYAILGPEFG